MHLVAIGKLVVLAGFAGWIIRDAIAGPPRLMAWAMFGHAMFCRLAAVVPDGAGGWIAFNQWQFIGNQDLLMDVFLLDDFLDFVQSVHGLAPTGTATLVADERELRLRVVDGGVEA